MRVHRIYQNDNLDLDQLASLVGLLLLPPYPPGSEQNGPLNPGVLVHADRQVDLRFNSQRVTNVSLEGTIQ